MRLEAGFDAFEPVPFDANVIVGRDENLSIGSSNAAVECGTSALLRFEQISEQYGNRSAALSTTARVSSDELLSTTMTSHVPFGWRDARLSSVVRRTAARLNVAMTIENFTA